ncbi:MAG: hypothetical protein HY689_00845 [Chloroflexi bacterium]|nr:hypothetical protein [Chloroflexota bacterium]
MPTYVCPMHPDVRQDQPGKCPQCGMDLVQDGATAQAERRNYAPLLIIIGLILVTSLAISLNDVRNSTFAIQKSISYFMTGFFLVFGGFKLINLQGFAEGYANYDLVARRIFAYGYVYPFIEISFGIAMIFAYNSLQLLLAELAIMAFSGLGVIVALQQNRQFSCMCLGTLISDIPLTQVTLVEDFGMAFLALLMLFLG